MALSPDLSPGTSPHTAGGSSVTFNGVDMQDADAPHCKDGASKIEGDPTDDILWDSSVSPASSLSRAEVLPPTSSGRTRISELATRRSFSILPVRTAGLRKVNQGSVYRAPHLDRMANGDLVSKAWRWRETADGEPTSPFEQAWRRRRSGRGYEALRPANQSGEASSCSPPDVKHGFHGPNGRRRLGQGNINQHDAVSAGAWTAADEAPEHAPGRPQGYPESPGARMASAARRRRDDGLAPLPICPTLEAYGEDSAYSDSTVEQESPEKQETAADQPLSPAKRRR